MGVRERMRGRSVPFDDEDQEMTLKRKRDDGDDEEAVDEEAVDRRGKRRRVVKSPEVDLPEVIGA